MGALLAPGEDVMIHASLGQLGQFEAGVDAIIEAMRGAIGPQGTIIMGTDTRSFARTGRFSMDQPSETGLLTERLRLTEGAKRSGNPMASYCAVGPRAAEYTERSHSHLDDNATITRLLANDGKMLLMGISYEKCTLYHLSEERLQMPYNFYKDFTGVLIEDGREVGPVSQRYYVRRDMSVRKDPAVAGRMIEAEGGVTQRSLGDGIVRAFKARAFDDCCMRALKDDPEAFLVKN